GRGVGPRGPHSRGVRSRGRASAGGALHRGRGGRGMTVPAAPPSSPHLPRPAASEGLAGALESQKDRLLPCVHCGFCLPACPTYTRLGDEADSPRGRLHLMLAVVEGRLDAGSAAFRTPSARGRGCRACEPVCPSGVEYGTLLEHAREASIQATPPGRLTRALMAVMGRAPLRSVFFLGGRWLRGSGLASAVARILPGS